MRKKPGTPPNGGIPHTPSDSQNPEPGSGSPAHGDTPVDASLDTPIEETAPVTPSPHLLSPAHQRFCQEFLFDLNGTQAYLRAYPDAQPASARVQASRLLATPNIRAEVQRLLDERATVTGITADRALIRLWETATADPNELVEVRIGACRHCWGLYHLYQYTDSEYERAEAEHIHQQAKLRKLAEKQGTEFEPEPFKGGGGTGYSPNRSPNPDCPECHGDGTPRSIIKDTGRASPGARALYGGVKYDKNGNMTVIVRDQLPALKLVAEHLGLLNGEPRTPTEADPLTALLAEIRGAHGAGSALPIVHEDPERRAPRQDVQDVEPKAKLAKPEPGSGPKKQWRASQ